MSVERVTGRTVSRQDEIYLAMCSPTTGLPDPATELRLRLTPGSRVTETAQDLMPARISISSDGYIPSGRASTYTVTELTRGMGIERQRADGSVGRFWGAVAVDTSRPGGISLCRQVDRAGRPSGVPSTAQLARGGSFGGRVWTAWHDPVGTTTTFAHWSSSGGGTWTIPGGATTPAGYFPYGGPIFWANYVIFTTNTGSAGYLHWFDLPTLSNGGFALDVLVATVIGDVLYVGMRDGSIRRATTKPPSTTSGSFTTVATVNDTIVQIIPFPNASGVIVPYVVGRRSLYAIDVAAGTAVEAGPPLPIKPDPLVATVLSSDGQLYIAQGLSVFSWDGSVARSVGLDTDDIPYGMEGGCRIASLANGGDRLYAYIVKNNGNALGIYQLVGGGWHCFSNPERSEGFTIGVKKDVAAAYNKYPVVFVSDAESVGKVWFSHGGPTGTNSNEAMKVWPEDTQVVAEGTLYLTKLNFGWHGDRKVAVMTTAETDGQSGAFGNGSISFYPLALSGLAGGYWSTYKNGQKSVGINLYENVFNTASEPRREFPMVGAQFAEAGGSILIERRTDRLSPRLVSYTLHAMRASSSLYSWDVSAVIDEEVAGLSPLEQITRLRKIVSDNSSQLAWFSMAPYDAWPTLAVSSPPPGQITGEHAADQAAKAVRITRSQLSITPGEYGQMRATVALSMTEVVPNTLLDGAPE